MVRLTCLVRRKPGMTKEQFHDHWRNRHGPLVAQSKHGSHVLRYEQHPRDALDYNADQSTGYDGVTMQWFADYAAYEASLGEDDLPQILQDVSEFIDTDHLEYIITDEPFLVFDRSVS